MTLCTPQPQLGKLINQHQLQEIISALQYKERPFVPMKYIYFIKEGIEKSWINIKEHQKNQDHKDTEALDDYRFPAKELYYYLWPMIEDEIRDKKVMIVDFGCGTGEPLKCFAEKYAEKKQAEAYWPVDFSEAILSIAKHNYSNWLPELPCHPIRMDWDGDGFAKPLSTQLAQHNQDVSRVYCCLGATTSNLVALPKYLEGLGKLTRKNQDYVLIDVPHPNGLHSANMRHINDDKPWLQSLLQLLGIPDDALKFETFYDRTNHRKVARTEIIEECHLQGGELANYNFTLPKGYKIELFYSQQYELNQFTLMLAQAGLHVLAYSSVQQGFRGVFFCKTQ